VSVAVNVGYCCLAVSVAVAADVVGCCLPASVDLDAGSCGLGVAVAAGIAAAWQLRCCWCCWVAGCSLLVSV